MHCSCLQVHNQFVYYDFSNEVHFVLQCKDVARHRRIDFDTIAGMILIEFQLLCQKHNSNVKFIHLTLELPTIVISHWANCIRSSNSLHFPTRMLILYYFPWTITILNIIDQSHTGITGIIRYCYICYYGAFFASFSENIGKNICYVAQKCLMLVHTC